MTARTRIAAGLTLSLVVSACAGDSSQGSRATVRDSAGVTIVENPGPIDVPSGWTIDPTPVFRVGWTEDGPEFQRVGHGVVMPGGGAMVADIPSSEIYTISADGSARVIAGRGEGPGEFTGIMALAPLGADSVLVTDTRNNRLTILDGEGTLLQEVPFQPILDFAWFGATGRVEGKIAVLPVQMGGTGRDEPGWKSRPVFLIPGLTEPPVVAELDPAFELPFQHILPPDSRNPVRHMAYVHAGRDGFVHVQSDRPRAAWYSSDGTLTREARWEEEVREVDEQDWATLEANGRRSIPEEQQEEALAMWREHFGGMRPLFGITRLDRPGNLWVADSGLAGRSQARYRVLSAEGEWLGHVDFPGPVTVLDITDSHALVVETGEFDVQAVALYSIVKPG